MLTTVAGPATVRTMANNTVVKVLTGASALNAAGQTDYSGAPRIHTLKVVAGAGVSAGAVTLELSDDGVNWFQPTTTPTVPLTTAAPGTFYATAVDIVTQYARARISTAITGGTVDAWIGQAP